MGIHTGHKNKKTLGRTSTQKRDNEVPCKLQEQEYIGVKTRGDTAMYDFAVVNREPGTCEKCSGSGKYRWGAVVNGKATHEGTCWSCQGTGKQTKKDMKRNRGYNFYKIRQIKL
jgi:DnaJ-class molecular chaperone